MLYRPFPDGTPIRSILAGVLSPVLLISPTFSQNPVYEFHAKPMRARVGILALSTSVHKGSDGKEDVYLAEISSKHTEGQLAKLVDSYVGRPIRREVLEERHPLTMTLTRDPQCDVLARTLFLGRQEDVFDSTTRDKLREHGSERIIPCFVVDMMRPGWGPLERWTMQHVSVSPA